MRDSPLSWQKSLAQGFRSAHELLAYLNLSEHLANTEAEILFSTRVPRHFAHLMEKGNPNDPLLRQVLSIDDELVKKKGFVQDPLQEQVFNLRPGVIHKYHGRVLLVLTGACAINCRYCFRRHFAYQENNPGSNGWQKILQEIAENQTINEVILSGGDPLLAQDELIASVISQLESFPHIKTLRIHSRIPIVFPERVNNSLIKILSSSKLNKVVVVHSNHSNELSEDVYQACSKLKASGCHLLNQSVLLQGVNDNVDDLVKLNKKLFDFGIFPYYLHILDKVEGVHHFDVSIQRARALFKEMQARLPGYLVPRLATEIPGQPAKTIL